jgi:hypothetical protein
MKFFNKLFKHPFKRGIYAILKGSYAGEYLVFVKEQDNTYTFFSLPGKVILTVPKDSFDNGFNNKILDFVERLPKSVYKVVESEYNSLNIKDGLRRTKKNNKPYKRSDSRAKNNYQISKR